MFDRLEFITRLVFKADAKEEIEKLKQEIENKGTEETKVEQTTTPEIQQKSPEKLPTVEEI